MSLALLIFAEFYYLVDRSSEKCNLYTEPISFQAAFGFSLITASTVGYGFIGSGDVFYFDCPLLVFIVYLQIMFSLMLNAFVVGLILQRVGRANTTAQQVLFSNKPIIRKLNVTLSSVHCITLESSVAILLECSDLCTSSVTVDTQLPPSIFLGCAVHSYFQTKQPRYLSIFSSNTNN